MEEQMISMEQDLRCNGQSVLLGMKLVIPILEAVREQEHQQPEYINPHQHQRDHSERGPITCGYRHEDLGWQALRRYTN